MSKTNIFVKKLFIGSFFILLLVAALNLFPISTMAAQTVVSGSCGENLTCVLDSDGVLTISGTGTMDNNDILDSSPHVWVNHRESITKVVIEEGVTSIGNFAFRWCKNITEFSLPDSLTSIGQGAFAFCEKITSIRIPANVEWIGKYAFEWNPPLRDVYITDLDAWMNIEFADEQSNPLYWATNLYLNGDPVTEVVIPEGTTYIAPYLFSTATLEKVVIPESVTKIGVGAFSESSLTEVTIPAGVPHIENRAFYYCKKLASIKISNSITGIGDWAFADCDNLKDIYYYGSEEQWEELKNNVGALNTEFLDANVHIEDQPFVVLSSIPSMNIEVGDTITLSAGVRIDQNTFGNASGVTFQLANGSTLDIVDSGTENGLFFVEFKGTYAGTTYVTFYDSISGQKATVTVTVSENDYFTYNVADVPEQYIEDFPTNFYNLNGLYIDNYRYETDTYYDPVTGAKKYLDTRVTFDVYNTNYVYAIVEVYEFNGELVNAILIDKRKDYSTSIYGVLGEGTAATVRGAFTGDLFNYRGEHNSTCTSVELDIPSNGYIKITSDPCESDLLAIINGVDFLLAVKSFAGELEGYDPFDSEFADAFTKKLIADTTFANLKKDGAKIFEKLFVDIGKELVITPKTVGDFADTLSKQLTELDLMDALKDSLLASGISMGENIFIEMFGLAGEAMETVFMIGKVSNLALAYNDFSMSQDSGAVRISNQGGGLRSAMGVTVRTTEAYDTFDSSVALQTYKVELDEDLLNLVKNADRESYELLTKGISHTYEISLMQNGKNIQHDGDVMVNIPIPEDIRSLSIGGNVKVYRIEEDGSLTDMDAVVENDCIVFTTEHFSLYTVVGYENKEAVDTSEYGVDSEYHTDSQIQPDSDNVSGDFANDQKGGNSLAVVIIVIIIILMILIVAVGIIIAIFFARKIAKKD